MTCNQTEYIIISERRGENSKMFELVNKKRNDLKKNKKGFTLVEVIVVLVILAILAALLIPAMTGWIKKANEKTIAAEARNVQLALQTVVSENFNDLDTITADDGVTLNQKALEEGQKLGEYKADAVKEAKIAKTDDTVTVSFTYDNGTYSIKYTAGKPDAAGPKPSGSN